MSDHLPRIIQAKLVSNRKEFFSSKECISYLGRIRLIHCPLWKYNLILHSSSIGAWFNKNILRTPRTMVVAQLQCDQKKIAKCL